MVQKHWKKISKKLEYLDKQDDAPIWLWNHHRWATVWSQPFMNADHYMILKKLASVTSVKPKNTKTETSDDHRWAFWSPTLTSIYTKKKRKCRWALIRCHFHMKEQNVTTNRISNKTGWTQCEYSSSYIDLLYSDYGSMNNYNPLIGQLQSLIWNISIT